MKLISLKGIEVLLLLVVIGVTWLACGGSSGDDSVTVTAKILLSDGTEKELSDTPLPLNVRIQLAFSEAVDTDLAEALLSFTANGREVTRQISWNDDSTVMTIKPKDRLKYQTTYSVSVSAGAITTNESSVIKRVDADAFSDTFNTMLAYDINGDGMADLQAGAREWNAGDNTGRLYLFYGGNLTNEGAGSADAVITAESADDWMSPTRNLFLNQDLNNDGYADLFCTSSLYSGGNFKGRSYVFYGEAGERPISGELDIINADLIFTGIENDDSFSASRVGDVNGDVYNDLVGIAYGCNSNTGCVYVFFGPTFKSETAAGADVVITGENVNDMFGANMYLHDFNGDGILDMVTSAFGYSEGNTKGRIYVFYGGSDLASMDAADADVVITGEDDFSNFLMERIADVNGDGTMDIMASAIGYDNWRGRAYVFYGGTLTSVGAGEADVIFTGEDIIDNEAGAAGMFGDDIIPGDFNGDGIEDILIGASEYDSYRGRIYGFFGGADLSSKDAGDADFVLTGESQSDHRNNALRASFIGDVNGDGVGDVLAHQNSYSDNDDKGRAYVFFGEMNITSSGAGEADVIFTGQSNQDLLHIDNMLDANGDGVYDLFLGAPGYNAGAETGRGYLFYGGSDLVSADVTLADVIIEGENAGDQFTN